MVPQTGTHQTVNLPKNLPEHPYLKDLEPLGWMHTQPSDTGQLSPLDIMQTADFIFRGNWDPEIACVLTISFTPGSCTLTTYKLTSEGLDWGRVSTDTSGYSSSFYTRGRMMIADTFYGNFLVPHSGVWNCNFMGSSHSPFVDYSLTISAPKEFFHEIHRPSHFLQFAQGHEEETENSDLFS